MINLIIVTGAYGAGKTLAAQAFEEAGYYVTDRMPLGVVDSYFEEIRKHPDKYQRVALVVEREIALETYQKALKIKEFKVKFFGFTCDANTLIGRFTLSRKVHPDEPKGKTLEQAINDDIEAIREIRDYFDVYIDTSNLSKAKFRNRIYERVIGSDKKSPTYWRQFGLPQLEI